MAVLATSCMERPCSAAFRLNASGAAPAPTTSGRVVRVTARIVLLGATGYTGGRTAQALVARGARPVLAGRDPSRLAELGERLGGLETARADITEVESVRRLVETGDVLVTTVGPFQRLGEPAVVAAADAGAVYLDSTGEAPFIRAVFERYGPRAERSGAALLTAFGSDWVPGNLAGVLALERARQQVGAAGLVTRLQVGYFMSDGGTGAVSRGTASSLFQVGLEPSYAWRAGRLVPERIAARLQRFDVDGRLRPAVSVGGTEQFCLPRNYPGLTDVELYLGWLGGASYAVQRLSGLTALLGRVPGAPAALAGVGRVVTRRLSSGPSPDAVAHVRSHVIANAYDIHGTLLGSARLDGPEAYGLTADLLAWAALRALEHGVAGRGALGPVEAFGLEALTAGAAEAGLVVTRT